MNNTRVYLLLIGNAACLLAIARQLYLFFRSYHP